MPEQDVDDLGECDTDGHGKSFWLSVGYLLLLVRRQGMVRDGICGRSAFVPKIFASQPPYMFLQLPAAPRASLVPLPLNIENLRHIKHRGHCPRPGPNTDDWHEMPGATVNLCDDETSDGG